MSLVETTDVVVLGGGPSGVAAALAAKEEGANVILVERYGFLGGMATAGLLGCICGFYGKKDDKRFSVVGGIPQRFLERLKELQGMNEIIEIKGKTYAIPYDIQAFKFVCDDLLEENGVDVILHAWATSVDVSEGTINKVSIQTKQGQVVIHAKVFIDTTGDGDIAAAAGAQYSLIPSELQLPSTLFTVANVDSAMAARIEGNQLQSLILTANQKGFNLPRISGSLRNLNYEGLFRLNITLISGKQGYVNGVDYKDLSSAEVEGRKQVREYFRFLKEYVPGFERSYIAEIAPQVGIRETRKIYGEYTLNVEDIMTNNVPQDVIALNAWPLEEHTGGPTTQWTFIPEAGFHGIPFRSLQPKGLKNLLIAGRCISATHEAQSSIRVMGPAMAMGEASGVAAAAMVKNNLIDSRDIHISKLQEMLVRRNAVLEL
jgi:glycine/D-amino acid oxidase-like deaminating enzyme